jgi:hypothetical protein
MAGVIPKHELKEVLAAVNPVVKTPEKVVEKVEEKPTLPPRNKSEKQNKN